LIKSKNIFLIGPMGAGKSSVGRRLAKRLKMQFLDSDQEIERRTGATVNLIFEIEGEPGFRRREKDIIGELTKKSGIVLATGGGAVLDLDNRKVLANCGVVIYLRTGLKQLVQRTSRDSKRPLLNTIDPAAKLQELLEIRGPLYENMADLIIDTDQRLPQSIVNEIAGHKILQ
jgi:shikimate kinase